MRKALTSQFFSNKTQVNMLLPVVAITLLENRKTSTERMYQNALTNPPSIFCLLLQTIKESIASNFYTKAKAVFRALNPNCTIFQIIAFSITISPSAAPPKRSHSP